MKTLFSIFFDSLRPVKVISIPLYLLAAIGVLLSDVPQSPDLQLIFQMAPWWVWMLLSLYMSAARVITVTLWQGNHFTRVLTPIVGITMWSMFFAASASAPNFSMGVLYLVAAFIEVWILARAFMEPRK